MAQDFIIVGAGSAGCVMAEKLSRDGRHRVLLLEAGGRDRSMFVHMPRGASRAMEKPSQVWSYALERTACTAGNAEKWVRGRMLGGSSSINGMIYNRGQQEDWDELAQIAGPGWSWASILPHFKSVEDQDWGDDPDHGTGGPLHISLSEERTPLDRAVIEGGQALGLSARQDLNARADAEVIGYVSRTIRNGRRWSTAQAFLRPAMGRANLRVVTGVTVERIVVEDGRAVGVQCSGALQGIERAGREVILSAGGLESPRLLQLSGIGPRDVLAEAGVAMVHESPEVGLNLIEHRCILSRWRMREGFSTNHDYHGARVIANAARWLVTGGGVMSSPYADIAAFMKIDPAADRPDGMLFIAPYSIDKSSGRVEIEREPGMTVNGYQLRPESRGRLAIRSSDPSVPVSIDANYLATPKDREIAIGILRYIRKLMATPALAPHVVGEVAPGPQYRTDEEILEANAKFGFTGYHLVGTCRMGTDPDSVLDPDLRVRGIDALRVVDCSSFPTMISGNTNGPVIATASRAADLILGAASNEFDAEPLRARSA